MTTWLWGRSLKQGKNILEVDSLLKLSGTGVVGAYGIRLLWQWLSREKQDSSLYKYELSAHEQTKKELAEERKLRKDAEMELRQAREAHDNDRNTWFEERDKDRELRESLRDEIFGLRAEVKSLKRTVEEFKRTTG